MAMDWTTLAGVVASVTGSQVLVQYLQNKGQKPKVEADSAQILVDQIMKWAVSLRAEIDALKQENEGLRSRLSELESKVCAACSHPS